MLKTPTFLVVAGLVVAGAVVNGATTQRWSSFGPDPGLTDRLHALELRFEDWQPTVVPTDMPTSERSTAISRRYASPTTNRSAVVSVISGIPGSVSAHTPDVCYPGSGYKTVREMKRTAVDLPGGRPAEMYVADFEKKTATKHDRVRVRWTWAADGAWVAPDRPRWQFATQLTRAPILHKVYIVTSLPVDTEERQEDDATTQAFIAATLTQYGGTAFGK